MPGSGFNDELTSEKISVRYHSTDMTQEAFKSIVARIEALPAFKGFVIVKTGEDAPEFVGAITGKGSCNAGRKPEQIVLTLKPTVITDSKNVVSEILWKQIETLYTDIQAMPELKSYKLNVINFYDFSEYDLDDKKPPKKLKLVFELYPDEQRKLDERIAEDNFNTFANKLVKYLVGGKNPDTDWQILKELIEQRKKETGRG